MSCRKKACLTWVPLDMVGQQLVRLEKQCSAGVVLVPDALHGEHLLVLRGLGMNLVWSLLFASVSRYPTT